MAKKKRKDGVLDAITYQCPNEQHARKLDKGEAVLYPIFTSRLQEAVCSTELVQCARCQQVYTRNLR